MVLRSLYEDFETAAPQARHTDNHEHPRIRWETKVKLACFKGRCQQRRANSERPLLAPFDPIKDKKSRALLAVEHFK